MSDGVVGVLGPHAEMVGELLEWWEDVASGRSSSQLVTVRTDRDWGTDVVAGLLVDAVAAGQAAEPPDLAGKPVASFWGARAEGGLAPSVANPSAMPSCLIFAADCFDDPTLGSDRAMVELASQFEGVATELKIAERPAAHSEFGLGDPGLVAAQLVSVSGALAALAGAGPLMAGGLVAADLVGAAWAQAMSALAFRRRYGSIGQNVESAVLANARMLGAVSLSVPVLMVLERTDLANEVMFDLALGATELNEGRVLAVMFEPDGHSGDRSARVSSRIGGLPTSQQHRVHTERADPVNSASLAATARKVCGAANSALVEAVVGQVNTMGGLGRLVRSPAIGAQLESGTLTPADVRAWVDSEALQAPVGVDQRRCLAVAGLSGPSVPSVVLTHVLGEPADTSVVELSDLGWLVEISPGLFRFPSGAAMATAAGTASELLTPQEQQATADAPTDLFRALTDPGTPAGGVESRAVLWTLAHRVADGPPPDCDLADRLWQVAQDAADQGAFMVAARLGRVAATEGENQTVRRVTVARWAEQITTDQLPDDDPIETIARGLLRLAARRNVTDELVVDQVSAALGELSGHVNDSLLAGWWLELAERLGERGETDRAEDALLRSREHPTNHADIKAGQVRLAVEFESGVSGRRRLVTRLTQELNALLIAADIRDDQAVIKSRTELAWLHHQLGESDDALNLAQAVLPDQVRVLGADHPDTLVTRNNIASGTGRVGDSRAALELFEGLLPDHVRVLGADHPDTLRTRNNIAFWTGRVGDSRAALELLEGLLPDQVRVLGADHPDTLRTRNTIAFLAEGLRGS